MMVGVYLLSSRGCTLADVAGCLGAGGMVGYMEGTSCSQRFRGGWGGKWSTRDW